MLWVPSKSSPVFCMRHFKHLSHDQSAWHHGLIISVRIFRESCIAVQDLLCYVQWPVMLQMRSGSEVKLPTCDHSLPSKWNASDTCTEAGLFEREETAVRGRSFQGAALTHPSKSGDLVVSVRLWIKAF